MGDHGTTRRRFTSVILGLLGVGAVASQRHDPPDRLKYGTAAFHGQTDGAVVDVYRTMGGEEIPASEHTEWLTGAPDNNLQQYIRPDDPTVQEYADALDVDSIHGERGELDFAGKTLPTYKTDDDLFGQNHIQMPDAYFELGEGDCDDYAVALSSIMEALGYDTRVVMTTMKPQNRDWSYHLHTEVSIDDDVYVLDTMRPGEYVARDAYQGGVVAAWTPLTMFGKDTPYQVYDPEWAA